MTEAMLAEPLVATDNFDLLARIPMRLSVEVGSASMTLAELIAMKQDAVVELDRQTDDPLDILVNGTLIARGEVVTVDGRYGIRISEIVAPLQGGIERRS
ncbi:MAG: fliN [Sphingomonadales bacterium]|nr:fliN [Sphingomonadales bacterium]